MNITCRIAILLAAAVGPVAAQKSFEVASIKAATPLGPVHGAPGVFRMSMGPRFGPGTSDPTRWACDNCPLKLLIRDAFQIKDFQITGPSWLDSERFDINARVAAGSTKDDLRQMQQNLLAERFGLKFHMEQKEMQVYDLVQGPKGHKMTVSTAPPPPAPGADGAPPPPPPLALSHGANPIKIGSDGFPDLPKDRTMTMTINGNTRHQAVGEDMEQFVQMLSANLNRPVTNSTGLTGRWDFTMNFQPPSGQGRGGPGGGGMVMMITRGPGGPGGGGGAPLAGPGGEGTEIPEMEAAPPIQKAVEQLGLKLEAKKAMADMMIIEKIEKTASEN